jgi:predicted Zn finger-like uncharacterized protein
VGRRDVSRHVSAALIFISLPLWIMSKSEPIPFSCPSCEAEYKIVTIEVCDIQQGKVRCLKCDASFPAGEGRVALKYFLVGRPRGRKRK